MNKFVNILLLLIILPTIGFTLVIGFDLPIELLKISGANFEYAEYVFLGLALLIGLINLRRSIRRWVGMNMVSQISRFEWNFPMNKKRVSQAVMYLCIEGVLNILVALALLAISTKSFPVAVVLFLFAIDSFVFAALGKFKKLFRVGITKNAVVFADRDVKIAYFSGLRKISIQQQSIYFDYIKELQISYSLDSINYENVETFKSTIDANCDRSRVHFTDNFKDYNPL